MQDLAQDLTRDLAQDRLKPMGASASPYSAVSRAESSHSLKAARALSYHSSSLKRAASAWPIGPSVPRSPQLRVMERSLRSARRDRSPASPRFSAALALPSPSKRPPF